MSTAGPEGPGAEPGETLPPLSNRERHALIARHCDRYAQWLLESRTAPSATREHTKVAVSFLRSLAARGRPLRALTEYHLRWYLYRWPPLEVTNTDEARRCLVSLKRFFEFLEESEGVRCPWAVPILRDEDAFWARCADGPWDNAEVQGGTPWGRLLEADLEARLLLPDPQAGFEWYEFSGPQEHYVQAELHRDWLLWRDEEIRGGITEPDRLRAVLLDRARAWTRTSNPRLRGLAPAEAIRRGRRQGLFELVMGLDEPESPFEAHCQDNDEHPELEERTESYTWFLVAHGLRNVRRSRRVPHEASVALKNLAAMLDPVEEEFDATVDDQIADPGLAALLRAVIEGKTTDPLFEHCLAMAREAVAAGALRTASALLRELRAVFPSASDALHARALMQQAEIAEQQGLAREASRFRLEAELLSS